MTLVDTVRRGPARVWADAALLLRAYIWIGRIDVRMRVAGFQHVVAALPAARLAPGEPIPADAIRRARRYARRIAWAARLHYVRARCLHRSLVLHYWLRHEGLPSALRIGVRKEDGELKAHAWVELGGAIVNDRVGSVSSFTVLRRAGQPSAQTEHGDQDALAAAAFGNDMWGD